MGYRGVTFLMTLLEQRRLDKLTELDKLHIRTATLSGKETFRSLGNSYGISVESVKNIRKGNIK